MRAASALANAAGVEPSIGAMRRVGHGFGGLSINRERLERAVSNIRWCFPDLDDEACADLARSAYRHLFMLSAEVCCTPRLVTPASVLEYVEFEGVERALELLRSGRPSLLVTGHCGNWELMGAALASVGIPVHALYRPLDMKPLDRWVQRVRRKQGIELVDKFGASQRLPGILDDGLPVGFIADQNAGDKGLFVPFFDRLASAYKTIGVLAMQYRAPVICGHAMRLAGDDPEHPRFRYRVSVTDIITPEDWADEDDPVFYITARYRRAIEMMVRAAPEQYLWMHRYWKSRPRHERMGKPFPARLRDKIAALPWMDDHHAGRIAERSEIDGEAWRRRHRPAV
ncbi:MAG: lysophospholipid acyltransferase family protein [Phycisphaerales bacterium]